jgi:outer membrane protein OmpA-like peptidoglycan-associated protein
MGTGPTTAKSVPPPLAREPRGPSMLLPGTAFVTGRANLRNDAATKARINALVTFVHANPGATIRVEGHTDNQGNPQANLILSQQRADAIKDQLRAAGFPASRVQAIGMGAEQPVASNATAQGRERNRRVEVIVLRNGN